MAKAALCRVLDGLVDVAVKHPHAVQALDSAVYLLAYIAPSAVPPVAVRVRGCPHTCL